MPGATVNVPLAADSFFTSKKAPTAEVTSAAAGDTCPYVDGEAGACVATAVDACA